MTNEANEIWEVMEARQRLVVALSEAVDSFPAMGSIVGDIVNDTHGHYVAASLDYPGKVAFARSPPHQYDASRRIKMSLTRYLIRKIPASHFIIEATIDKFTSFVESKLTDTSDKFHILRGRAIVTAYDDAVGGISCMTGMAYDDSYVQIYGCNDNIALLVYTDEKMSARALLWTTDEGERVLDRIYPNSGYHIDLYREWCQEHDVRRRKGNSLPEDYVDIEGSKDYSVTLKKSYNAFWPYMDTFRYCEEYGNFITLSNCPGDSQFCLNTVNGDTSESEENGERCEDCSELLDEDHYNLDDGTAVCSCCIENNYWTCDRNGSIHNSNCEDSTFIVNLDEYWCESAVDSDAITCPLCDDCVSSWTGYDSISYCDECGSGLNDLAVQVEEINNLIIDIRGNRELIESAEKIVESVTFNRMTMDDATNELNTIIETIEEEKCTT